MVEPSRTAANGQATLGGKLLVVTNTNSAGDSHLELVIWRDGQFVPYADATTHVLSHMAARGSQVFDVLLAVQHTDGLKAIGLREHVTRFLRSAELMGMIDVGSVGPLEAAVAQTALANQRILGEDKPDSFAVKLLAVWEGEPVGLIPATLKPTVFVVAVPNRGHQAVEPWPPIKLKTAVMPKVPASVLPPGLKVAASYTGGVRELLRARAEGYDEIIFKTIDGNMAESTTLSAFIVSEEKLLAPPLDTVLDGITRRLVLDVAASLGIATQVRPVRWSEVESADEIFLSSTNKPVVGISHLDDRALPPANPVTSLLSSEVIKVLKGNHSLSARWLTQLVDPV